MVDKGWLSPWAIFDGETDTYVMKDYRTGSPAPAWTFPAESGNVLLSASEADINGDIAASVDHSSGIILNNRVYNDYGTLVTGQEYKAGYFRYNVRSTTPGNPVAEVTGLEGVAASYIADEALTFRGGYFRTYTDAGVSPTMRTAIGCEISARASYSGGTECVAEAGTAFVGARIWMAPFFSDASITNINNLHALWIINEATGKFVTNAIKIDATTYNSGFTYSFNADSGKFRLALDGSEAGSGLVAGETVTTSGDDWLYLQADDYRTLTSGQTYRAAYFRYNVRSTTPSNPTCEVTGVEGVAGAYVADEAITFRGGHFRTYINADATSTMRTNIGLETSARASYSGGTECVAEAGTAFVGARIWMAPYFTAGSVGNINNFWGLWIYGEHSSQRNADAAIYISDAGGGFTDIIRFTAAGGADADVTFAKLLVTGTPTIIWDESEDRWSFNKGLAFTAAGGIKFGSYASPVDLGSSTVFGFGQCWGSGSGGSDPFIIGMQFFVKTTETARPFPLCVQAEINNDGATYPDRGQAAQFIILLGGGGEASKLGALGGDATAGMYAGWFKVGANVSCSTESGCRVAPLWIDNQMYCVVNGEEYAAFITTGGSVPDAVFGFETTSSGWSQLLYFDETAYNKDPISSNYFKVLLNSTQLYIPTSTTAGSFTGTLGANTVTGQLTFTTGSMVMGSYGSPQDLGSSTVFGFGQFWGSGSGGGDPFIIGMQFFVKTTETARPFPLCVQAEINNDGATYPDRGQAAQFIILLGGGGEASHLGGLGGDAVAGMYAGWFKVGANVGCSTEADARVAPLWIDNQMNCVVAGEEYAAFITCGGSKVDAVFGFETTSSGWSYLFLFDETSYDQDPVGAGNITGGNKDYNLKCSINGVAYGIQLYSL